MLHLPPVNGPWKHFIVGLPSQGGEAPARARASRSQPGCLMILVIAIRIEIRKVLRIAIILVIVVAIITSTFSQVLLLDARELKTCHLHSDRGWEKLSIYELPTFTFCLPGQFTRAQIICRARSPPKIEKKKTIEELIKELEMRNPAADVG